MMARTFTRKEFYDLVWSKPMTHLAKEFALSDVALHKVCKKHNIPNPPLGWWAKKAAGKPVKQTALPRMADPNLKYVTIAAGELRAEPDLIVAAREKARVLASAIDLNSPPSANRIVELTVAELKEAKATGLADIVVVKQPDLINVGVHLASADSVARRLRCPVGVNFDGR